MITKNITAPYVTIDKNLVWNDGVHIRNKVYISKS